jgi:hypothetical protein
MAYFCAILFTSPCPSLIIEINPDGRSGERRRLQPCSMVLARALELWACTTIESKHYGEPKENHGESENDADATGKIARREL